MLERSEEYVSSNKIALADSGYKFSPKNLPAAPYFTLHFIFSQYNPQIYVKLISSNISEVKYDLILSIVNGKIVFGVEYQVYLFTV